jgi:hypothetical protein
LDDLDGGNIFGQSSDQASHDGAGVMVSEAEMRAESKSDVWIRSAIEFRFVWFIEDLRIAVGGRPAE